MKPDSEQNCYSRLANGVYMIGHDSIWLWKWMAFFDGYYRNRNYFDLIGYVLSA